MVSLVPRPTLFFGCVDRCGRVVVYYCQCKPKNRKNGVGEAKL